MLVIEMEEEEPIMEGTETEEEAGLTVLKALQFENPQLSLNALT